MARHTTPAASEFLLAALHEPGDDVHLQVVHILGRCKDRRAVERLLGALAGARAACEQAARAREAASEDDRDSLEELREALGEWPGVIGRLGAYVRALAEIGDERAFEPIHELLEVEGVHNLLGLVMEVVSALGRIDNTRAAARFLRLVDDPSHPSGDRMEMTLAGMDLIASARSLASRDADSNLGALRRGLHAIQSSRELPHPRGSGIGGYWPEQGEYGRISMELMRRLEEVLRGLGRGRPGT